jgi:predicted DNA-binding ribbon-helix-helix protein
LVVIRAGEAVKSSVRNEFWKSLNEIASEQGMILAELVRTIDANRN